MDEKSVSLNEAERRQEMARLKAQQEARKQEELAHPTREPVTYEITPENASAPGLPPPLVAKKNGKSSAVATSDKKSSSSPDDLDQVTGGKSPDSDIILHETEKILADYVDLLGAPAKGPGLAGPRAARAGLVAPRPRRRLLARGTLVRENPFAAGMALTW